MDSDNSACFYGSYRMNIALTSTFFECHVEDLGGEVDGEDA